MSDAPEPLSPEVEAFLAPERRCSDPPAEIQNDVFSRIGATLGLPGGPGPGESSPPAGAPPSAPITGGGLAGGALAKTLVTLAVGGALGAGVHEAYDRARDRRAEHAAIPVVAPPPATTPPATLPPPATPPPAVRAPEPTTASEARRPPAKAEHSREVEIRERDRGLGAERALIEQARTALSRDKSGDALAALERHARDFPQGELEEERESLQVHALVGLERYDQARKVGARFHRRFPRSIFGAVVDEVLRSIP